MKQYQLLALLSVDDVVVSALWNEQQQRHNIVPSDCFYGHSKPEHCSSLELVLLVEGPSGSHEQTHSVLSQLSLIPVGRHCVRT
jgi:hypothetical protein